ncbi:MULTISPECIES: ABC transporter permease [unclassified Streptomyces]|uniref:ABC transporter permease n=1 Tax=unclassified Streptomyces TaxID=2593676 RepID=UPI004041168C
MSRIFRRRQRDAVEPSFLLFRDLLSEALTGILQRPGRSALTTLGTILGVGSFVAVLGLTSTATGQIGKSFSVLQATTVTVNDTTQAGGTSTVDFPADADQRVESLNGVTAAGVWWSVPLRTPVVATSPIASGSSVSRISVFAASPGALNAMEPTLEAGKLYGRFHQRRGERVCVLGAGAARLLGVSRVDNTPVVFINNIAYTVLGIFSDVQRLPQMLVGVVIPSSTALKAYGPPTDNPAQMVIHTHLGAAQLIAHQAPLALRPENPGLLKAVPPPNPHTLRDAVDTSLSGLFLLLAAISLVIGAVGIANTTLVAILERTGEIGLRRSLGARPRHIAAQFLTESATLGTLGGLLGTSIGVSTVVLVAVIENWTAVLNPLYVMPAPLMGSGVGLLAGLYPALRAARIEPLEALRRH